MSRDSKKREKKTVRKPGQGSAVKDYGKEPYFVQKAEASRVTITKYGLPKALVTGNSK
jgi:hypothetical protein